MPKESDGHLGKLLRATLVGLLSLFCYKDPKVAEEASRRFQQHLKDPADINALPSEYKVSRHSTRTKELQPWTQRSRSSATDCATTYLLHTPSASLFARRRTSSLGYIAARLGMTP
jgi:hypothetical protein